MECNQCEAARIQQDAAFDMIEASIRSVYAARMTHDNIRYDGEWRADYDAYLGRELDELAARRKQAKAVMCANAGIAGNTLGPQVPDLPV